MIGFVTFARRQNHDSSIDSICTRCYQTIATSRSVYILAIAEATHLCDPFGEYTFPFAVSQLACSSSKFNSMGHTLSL